MLSVLQSFRRLKGKLISPEICISIFIPLFALANANISLLNRIRLTGIQRFFLFYLLIHP